MAVSATVQAFNENVLRSVYIYRSLEWGDYYHNFPYTYYFLLVLICVIVQKSLKVLSQPRWTFSTARC